MQLKPEKFTSKIIWILNLLMFSFFYLFESYTWGKYCILLAAVIVFISTALLDRGRYQYRIEKFHRFIGGFIVFTLLSSVWAITAKDSIQKAITIAEIFVCMSVMYNYYFRKENGVRDLLSVIKWSSYIVVLYSLYYYGVDFIRTMVLSGTRIDNSYTNINTLGMLAATGIVIQIDELIGKRKLQWSVIFCFPSIYIIAATQSRKAITLLVLGILGVLLLRNIDNRSALKNIVRVVVVLMAFYIVLRYASTLAIFSGVNERLESLFAMITGQGDMGASARTRQELIVVGLEQFKKTPIAGIGIGCPHYLAAEKLSFDAYLHNNYVELLAGGGLIGFLIYYSMYGYLIVNMLRYRKVPDNEFVIVLVLIGLHLVMDYGSVSVYSKSNYYYLMIFFLEVRKMRNKIYCVDAESYGVNYGGNKRCVKPEA